MAFRDKHSPSILAKVVLSAGVLAGTLLSAVEVIGVRSGNVNCFVSPKEME